MPTSRVVVAQPTHDVWNFENPWHKGLCDCCDNSNTCLFAYFCFICFLLDQASAMADFDLTDHDNFNLCICCRSWFGYVKLARLYRRTGECCGMCLVPGSLMALRAKLRTGFRIRGNLCYDFMTTNCCPWCAAIQMSNELDHQEL